MDATIEQIIESNRIKKESCSQCMEDLKGTVTLEQLEHLKNTFMNVTKGYIFSEKAD